MKSYIVKNRELNATYSKWGSSSSTRSSNSRGRNSETLSPNAPELQVGQKYAEVKLDVEVKPFQRLLPDAPAEFDLIPKDIVVYFVISQAEADPFSYTVVEAKKCLKICAFGEILDKLLEQRKGIKLQVDTQLYHARHNDFGVTTKEMVGVRNKAGGFYFEDTVELKVGQHITNTLVGYYISIALVPDHDDLVLPNVQPMLNKLLVDQRFTDFALVSNNGTKFPCLKAFLVSASSVFDRMLESDCEETKEGVCKLDVSELGVKSLLQFIYRYNVDDALKNPFVAFELLEIGHKYDIPALETAMKGTFLNKPAKWMGIDVALLLFTHSNKLDGYDHLKKRAVQTIKLKKEELDESQVFDQLTKHDPDTTKKLFALAL